MSIFVRREEFVGSGIIAAEGYPAIPWPDRDIGDRIVGARDIFAFGEAAVEDVELALGLHGVAVDRIFDLHWGVGEEMAEASAEEWRAAHLPKEPRQGFGSFRAGRGQEFAEFLGEI